MPGGIITNSFPLRSDSLLITRERNEMKYCSKTKVFFNYVCSIPAMILRIFLYAKKELQNWRQSSYQYFLWCSFQFLKSHGLEASIKSLRATSLYHSKMYRRCWETKGQTVVLRGTVGSLGSREIVEQLIVEKLRRNDFLEFSELFNFPLMIQVVRIAGV